ncbi:hypothetical protein BDV95DRAFT_587477 [Massariosphaeria phaeospora]|uniref:Uncharacterized protein n=1 Tax=Massariosphaeria phaeospora TaxID=100035 RepID=A0A7C8I141_9PLEO|nr:hypothetical protein BDV95DRAFT_587477 [Massariosphaeria phaeospora]
MEQHNRPTNSFPSRMKKAMQRIWASIKGDRKATRTAQMVDESDVPPPSYTEVAAEVIGEASIQKFNESTGAKSNGSTVPKPNQLAVPEPKKDAVPTPTGSNDQKPTENNARKPEKSTVVKSTAKPEQDTVVKSTPTSQLELDYSTISYPRLTALAKSKVDKVRLLRSILVFIMFITFFADLDKIGAGTDSLFPLNTNIYTDTDISPLKFFAWDVFEITRDIATLVRHLEQLIRDNRWFHARREHKDLLTQLVLKPAESLMIQADYALEILGAFRQDRECEDDEIDYDTLVDYWTPKNRKKSADLLVSYARLGRYSDIACVFHRFLEAARKSAVRVGGCHGEVS